MERSESERFDIDLITCIRNYPQIFDNVNYPPELIETKIEVNKIWDIISSTLEATREECIDKWNRIRNNYEQNIQNENGSSECQYTTYSMSTHLEFLVPFYGGKELARSYTLPLPDTDYDAARKNGAQNIWRVRTSTEIDINDIAEIEQIGEDVEEDEEITLDGLESIPEPRPLTPLPPPSGRHLPKSKKLQPAEIEELERYVQKMKRPSDLGFCIRLLKCIKKNPMIYDNGPNFRTPNYDTTKTTWDQISKECKATVPKCMHKWRAMRASHQRYLRNINTATAPYYLSEYMKFLIPHYGKQYLSKSYEYIQDDDPIDDLSSLNDFDDPDTNMDDPNPNMDDQMSSVSDVTDDIITYKSNETIIPPKRKTITEMIADNFPDDESTFLLPQCKKPKHGAYSISSSVTSETTVIDNGDLMFLKSLLPDLALLDRTRKINFRISVLNLVRELVNSM